MPVSIFALDLMLAVAGGLTIGWLLADPDFFVPQIFRELCPEDDDVCAPVE